MEISTRYNAAETEARWYAHWEHRGYFRSVPDDREPFTIVIPPPNVTGVLHMGHMLNNTIQDILIRKARLDGKNACWVPGTDHASIATEAKVVRWLREEKKLRKADITRDEFMGYAYQWKEKYGGIILQQLRKLGASCDWERTAFTMDPNYYRDVIRVFLDLYQKGKLYRGLRMVNWDPEAKTVLSNEEVLYKEESAQLYHITYLEAPPSPPEGGEGALPGYMTADPMQYGRLKEFAKRQKDNPTDSEKYLWDLLLGKQLEGHKFRRQHIIGQFIADFVCLDKKLIIEVDGSIHQLPEQQISDAERTECLNNWGFNVIRFSKNEVLHNKENTLKSITEALAVLPTNALATPHPPLGGAGGAVVIATQRPETIFADVAIAVNPKDERYKSMVGKTVMIPLINRPIPIIADDYVDIEFGTGALKITPAHDPNDYEVGQRHKLEVIDIINDDGTISDACGFKPLVGLDRFEARKRMKALLEESGNLVEIEDYNTNIGRSERTNAVVEPKLSLQWFVNMSSLGEPALKAVQEEAIKFFPPSFQNLYRDWMENLRDWCISRQLWWGQRIPAWYLKSEALSKETHVFVAETEAEALAKAQEATGNKELTLNDLRQDEDVLDTWASSWLWPISVFDGFENPDGEFSYYYPTNVIVTGWDIIFFWVARMIMAGYEFKGQKPFQAVYFTGMVRDNQRRKMSKSLGNSPDALQLIETFGADGVRYGLMSSAAAGGDILFEDKLCENGRNFCNKLWNALRLVKGWQVVEKPENEDIARKNKLAVQWFREKFQTVLADLDSDFQQFRLSEALLGLYTFIWDDFCSWYLEMIKPAYEQPIDRETYEATLDIYSNLMVALHPFLPFVTEEVWHTLRDRKEGDDCCVQQWQKPGSSDKQLIDSVEKAKDVISKVRDLRNQNQIKPREPLALHVQESKSAEKLFAQTGLTELVVKLAVLSELTLSSEEPANAKSFISGTDKFYVALNQEIDVAAEIAKLKQELEYQRGFIRSVEAKLSNERFVSGAPKQVVDNERKKLADGQARMAILEDSLVKLNDE